MTDNFSCEVSCEHELLSLLGNSLDFDAYFVQTAKLELINRSNLRNWTYQTERYGGRARQKGSPGHRLGG
jgi:hypothetical protein